MTTMNTRIVNQAMRELKTNLHGLGLSPKKEQGLTLMFSAVEPHLVTETDIQVLKQASKDPSEHPYIKGILSMILFRILVLNGDPIKGKLEKARAWFKLVQHSTEVVWCRESRGPGFMASIETNLKRPTYGWLTICDEWKEMVEGMEDDDMYFGDDCLYTEAQKAALRTRSEMARDSVCANCGVKEQEDSFGSGIVVKKLKKCQGCQDVSYCSRECQKQAWKPSHKNYCRDISVLKAGDIVRLRGLKAQADLNGHLYEIREFDELKGRWRATWVGGSHDLSVKPDNLTRVLTVEERNDLIAHN